MTDFTTAEIKPLLKRKKDCSTVNLSLFTGELIFALAAAALSRYTEKQMGLFIAMLCLFAMGGIALLLFNLLYAKKITAQLKLEVCRIIAEAFYAEEELLTGGKAVELTASLDKTTLEIARVGFLKEITVSAAHGLNSSSGRLQFDLSALKSTPSVYSSVGEHILTFLEAYYVVNYKKGFFERVTVNDDTGKKRATYNLIADGVPTFESGANYFIETGLIK